MPQIRWSEPRKQALGLLIVALLLSLPGMVPMADDMTARVLAQVEDIPWATFYLPFTNPPPMESSGVRPTSVALMKLWNAAFGAHSMPPDWARYVRSVLSLWLFGLGAVRWLSAQEARREALPATVATMCLGPSLFSAWYVPEFDVLGAGATLWLSALLVQPRAPDRGAWAAIVAFGVLSFGLKESSALMQFAFLGAGILLSFFEGNRAVLRRHLLVAAVATVSWTALSTPLLRIGTSQVSARSWTERWPILENTLDQFPYLLSAMGTAFLLYLGLRPRFPRLSDGLLVATLLGLFLCPLVVFYSHYEAVYYSPRWFPLLVGTALLVGLGLVLLPPVAGLPPGKGSAAGPLGAMLGEKVEGLASAGALLASGKLGRATALSFAVALLLYLGALLGAPSAREDLASRIFLALSPGLYALGIRGVFLALSATRGLPRVVTVALAIAWAWYPFASGLNFTLDWRARHRVEHKGRDALSKEPLDGAVVLFNHYLQLVGPYELQFFGAPSFLGKTSFFQATAWSTRPELPVLFWGERLRTQDVADAGVPFYVYWYAARSRMHANANAALVGDLSWTRRKYGLFTPYDYVQEIPGLPPSPDTPARSGAPPENRPEELRKTTYSLGLTPLEEVIVHKADILWSGEVPFSQVPLQLTDLPRRTWEGVPVVEGYVYESRLYRYRAGW